MRRARKPINQINVVPYIDVMLVLLIIFMVTAPLIAPGEIELPSVGSRPNVPINPLKVRVANDKSIWLQDESTKGAPIRVARDQLAAQVVKLQRPDQPVVIEADKNIRYQDVIDVLDVLQRNGVKRVGLLARPTG